MFGVDERLRAFSSVETLRSFRCEREASPMPRIGPVRVAATTCEAGAASLYCCKRCKQSANSSGSNLIWRRESSMVDDGRNGNLRDFRVRQDSRQGRGVSTEAQDIPQHKPDQYKWFTLCPSKWKRRNQCWTWSPSSCFRFRRSLQVFCMEPHWSSPDTVD